MTLPAINIDGVDYVYNLKTKKYFKIVKGVITEITKDEYRKKENTPTK